MDAKNNLVNFKSFSWKRILIVILLILFSTTMICGVIYISMNEIIKTQNNQIELLTNQINNTTKNIHKLSIE